jgi:acyl-CoA reductase-like NAD-dependent aldehyde dehydrogenase
VSTAQTLAAEAADAFRQHPAMGVGIRAALLKELARALRSNVDRLVALAHKETHLGHARLTGEIHRTCFQLDAFADYILAGKHLRRLQERLIDAPPPTGRPALELTAVPVGPVAVFAASNFPFAFSVLGGDTASALAAGCPVVVKAHPAHLALSREIAVLAQRVLAELSLPAAWISLLDSGGIEAGAHLVVQPGIAAVGFTGSLGAGRALAGLIAGRPHPIPFFGELGSINPVLVMPEFLSEQPAISAHALADAMAQGAGQFCTSPGLLIIAASAAGDAFVQALASRLDGHTTHPMLTPGMQDAFDRQLAKIRGSTDLVQKTAGPASADPAAIGPTPTLVEVSLQTFTANAALQEEIFGPYAVVIRVPPDAAGYAAALVQLEGSLTLTFWAVEKDSPSVNFLLPMAMHRAGRVLFGGVPTGVAVTEAQHHGGPWPASTRPDTTSVGMRAIERFLRPVALQSKPEWAIS